MKTELFFCVLAVLLLVSAWRDQSFALAVVGSPDALKNNPAWRGPLQTLFEKTSRLFFEGKEELVKSINDGIAGLKTELKKQGDAIDERLKKAEEQVKENGKVDEELKGEIKKLAESHKSFSEQVDSRLAEIQRIKGSEDEPKVKTFSQIVREAFKGYKHGEKGIKEAIEASKGSKAPINIELNKAVADMTSATHLTGSYFAGYDQRPGVTIRPLYDGHFRPRFNQTTTTKDTIRYVRETGFEGGADVVAQGAQKPQIDFDFDVVDSPVRKLAVFFRLPEEMIDDIPYLLSYISGRGLEELQNKEDQQILTGSGSGQNLSGIDTVATAFAAGTLVVATPNRYDVLVASKLQLRNQQLTPTEIWVNPIDYVSMRLAKLTTGEYIFPVIPGTDIITCDGTPIIQNTRVAAGTFYTIDARWAEIVDRMQSNIRLFEQDRDNAIKNLVTVVIEERLAFPIYRPSAFIKGTFAAAITDLTS